MADNYKQIKQSNADIKMSSMRNRMERMEEIAEAMHRLQISIVE